MAKVKTAQGWLEGERLETVTGDAHYYSFKGIPYAQPPLGKLRFKAPVPPLPWDGVRKATEHGNMCPQNDIFTNEFIPGNEDCLYLNVYTPNLKPESPLPVMLFIHGGGYKSGSGNDTHYGPDFLVSHGVVLVTFNYRLEVLGFLCLDTEDVPGNAGMKDQVAVLRWLKENIANFGGDADNVTVFGESAGGASTALHVLSPMSKGLFRRAISMSGVPFCDWSVPYQPQKRAFILGKQLGLDTDDPQELLDFLQSVPVEKLVHTNPTVIASEEITNNILKMYHFVPIVEKDFGKERFLTEDPEDSLKKGDVNEVDVLIGHTSEEVLLGIKIFEDDLLQKYNRYEELLAPKLIAIKSTPDTTLEISRRIRKRFFAEKHINTDSMRQFVTYCNESSFVYHIHRYLYYLSKFGKTKNYLYKFSSVSERNIYGIQGQKYGLIGASHLDDLMYLFDAKFAGIKCEKGSKSYDLVQQACTVFTNFAKYGNPTPDSSLGMTWPEYDQVNKFYVDIGDTLTLRSASDAEDSLQFWRSIYEYAGLEF